MNDIILWLLAINLTVAGIADVVLMLRWGPQHTISFVLLGMVRDYPIIAVAVGVLIGHLFWPQIPGGLNKAVEQNGHARSALPLPADTTQPSAASPPGLSHPK